MGLFRGFQLIKKCANDLLIRRCTNEDFYIQMFVSGWIVRRVILKTETFFRHLLMSAGPQFSEELWHSVCKGLKQITNATLANLKELLVCFQPGSTSVGGDNGMQVKVVARKDLSPQDTTRFQQIAEQVFLQNSLFSLILISK